MLFEIAGKAVERARVATTSPVMTIPAKGRTRGEAVVLHKTAPLRFRSLRRFDRHSNYQELLNIVSSLAELGFRVTVVDRECPTGDLPRKKFDVVMGLAAGNSGLRLPELYERSPNSTKVGYCAGPEPAWSNQAISSRYHHAFTSRGLTAPEERQRVIDQSAIGYAIEMSDCLIVHGNQSVIDSYRSIHPSKTLYRVNGIALSARDSLPPLRCKDRNFLSIGGSGGIVKGIDLVIDAAGEFPNSRFGYCGPVESDLKQLFGGSIPRRSNWTEYGFVWANSSRFASTAEEYCFGVLPSCKEGMATSVLTMMGHGLIPLVTRECGVDVEGFGILLRVNESIASAINHSLALTLDEILQRRVASFESALTYTGGAHRKAVAIALRETIGR